MFVNVVYKTQKVHFNISTLVEINIVYYEETIEEDILSGFEVDLEFYFCDGVKVYITIKENKNKKDIGDVVNDIKREINTILGVNRDKVHRIPTIVIEEDLSVRTIY